MTYVRQLFGKYKNSKRSSQVFRQFTREANLEKRQPDNNLGRRATIMERRALKRKDYIPLKNLSSKVLSKSDIQDILMHPIHDEQIKIFKTFLTELNVNHSVMAQDPILAAKRLKSLGIWNALIKYMAHIHNQRLGKKNQFGHIQRSFQAIIDQFNSAKREAELLYRPIQYSRNTFRNQIYQLCPSMIDSAANEILPKLRVQNNAIINRTEISENYPSPRSTKITGFDNTTAIFLIDLLNDTYQSAIQHIQLKSRSLREAMKLIESPNSVTPPVNVHNTESSNLDHSQAPNPLSLLSDYIQSSAEYLGLNQRLPTNNEEAIVRSLKTINNKAKQLSEAIEKLENQKRSLAKFSIVVGIIGSIVTGFIASSLTGNPIAGVAAGLGVAAIFIGLPLLKNCFGDNSKKEYTQCQNIVEDTEYVLYQLHKTYQAQSCQVESDNSTSQTINLSNKRHTMYPSQAPSVDQSEYPDFYNDQQLEAKH